MNERASLYGQAAESAVRRAIHGFLNYYADFYENEKIRFSYNAAKLRRLGNGDLALLLTAIFSSGLCIGAVLSKGLRRVMSVVAAVSVLTSLFAVIKLTYFNSK